MVMVQLILQHHLTPILLSNLWYNGDVASNADADAESDDDDDDGVDDDANVEVLLMMAIVV